MHAHLDAIVAKSRDCEQSIGRLLKKDSYAKRICPERRQKR